MNHNNDINNLQPFYDYRFTIDEATGLISAKDKLDRETKAKYTLKVRAEDKGNPKRSAEVFVDINVSDVNDNDPTFNPSSYHIKIKEDAGVGSRITEVILNMSLLLLLVCYC